MKTIIAINGACGCMGQGIVQLAHDDPDLTMGAALDSAASSAQGRDIGEIAGIGRLGVPVTSAIAPQLRIDAIIDFLTPAGTLAVLPTCADRRIPIVVHGASEALKREVEAVAHFAAILFSPNLSLVVNVLFKLVHEAATALRDKGFDVEIIERHHRYKKDSPSGTALPFARILQEAMGEMPVRHGREGLVGEHPSREIGMHAIRAGEHTIIFSTLSETMEQVHKGHTRDAYIRGALQAAIYLAMCPAGRYTMADVLGG